jgi:hypothetical protein
MKAQSVLFALLRASACEQAIKEDMVNICTPEMLEGVYALAAKHDLAHLVCHALEKLSLPACPAMQKFQRAKSQAIFRFVKLDHAYAQILGCLEDAQIPFIPLKGSVLRGQYPEAWMRTSCDIDILVHEKDLDRAQEALISALAFQSNEKGDHDIAMTSPAGVSLELHYDTVQQRYANDLRRDVLATFWERAVPVNEKAFEHRIPDDLFYFYHIAHMAKHFEGGGCGVRPFIDLWLLNRLDEGTDRKKCEDLLESSELLTFARAAEKLSRVWLGGEERDALSSQMEDYLLQGGVYGSTDNRVAAGHQKKGGKLRYLWSRIFLPYPYLKTQYPILERYGWLAPVMHLRRWCRLLKPGAVKRAQREVEISTALPAEKAKEVAALMQGVGLAS